MSGKKRVLILCTGNSARSQMAEGLLRHDAGDQFDVESAGTKATQVRPEAIAAMRELSVDISGHRVKNVSQFEGQRFDYVITVCDHARETCPVFFGAAQRIDHDFEDPAAATGSEEERLHAFRRVRDQLRAYLRDFSSSQPAGRSSVDPEQIAKTFLEFVPTSSICSTRMPVLSVTQGPRDQLLKNLDKLPKLSPMLVQLLGIVAQPDCEVDDLVKVIEKDAVLSAQVLQKANSAAFGRRTTIRTIQHAVALVGMGTMRRFALGSSVSNLFARQKTARGFSTRRFNLHAAATATLSEFLSEALPMETRSGAFVAGLLHDIGELLIATSIPKTYETVLEVVAASGDPQIEIERKILGTDHAELSAMAIFKWELDSAAEVAARYHHEPERAPDVQKSRIDRVPLTMIVHRADSYVESLGLSILPPRLAKANNDSLEFPGFFYREDELKKKFEDEWKSLAKLFK